MLEWLLGSKSIDELIARKEYQKAIEAAKAGLEKQPDEKWLRLRLADALALAGDKQQAATLLVKLADEYVREGFATKGIALLKKIQRLDPSRSDVDEKLASLVSAPAESAEDKAKMQQYSDKLKAALIYPSAPGAAPTPLPPPPRAPKTGIARTPLFSEFSEAELLAVIRGLKLETYEPGEIIVSEGESGDSLFVLAEGTVRVYVKNAARRNVQIREMSDGAFFGEISILAGKDRTATITAGTRCELLELDRKTLDAIAEKQPHVKRVLEEFYEQRAHSSEEASVRQTGA